MRTVAHQIASVFKKLVSARAPDWPRCSPARSSRGGSRRARREARRRGIRCGSSRRRYGLETNDSSWLTAIAAAMGTRSSGAGCRCLSDVPRTLATSASGRSWTPLCPSEFQRRAPRYLLHASKMPAPMLAALKRRMEVTSQPWPELWQTLPGARAHGSARVRDFHRWLEEDANGYGCVINAPTSRRRTRSASIPSSRDAFLPHRRRISPAPPVGQLLRSGPHERRRGRARRDEALARDRRGFGRDFTRGPRGGRASEGARARGLRRTDPDEALAIWRGSSRTMVADRPDRADGRRSSWPGATTRCPTRDGA